MGIWRGQHSRTAVIGLAFVAFVVCCVLPVAYLLATTLGTSRTVAALDCRQQGLLLNTALLGIGTAALASAIGAPLGMVLARVPLRRRGVVRLLAGAPVLLPPYIVALAWVNLGWDWLSDMDVQPTGRHCRSEPCPVSAVDVGHRGGDAPD